MKTNFRNLVIASGFAIGLIFTSNVNAFSFIKKPAAKPAMTPAILMPGESAPIAKDAQKSEEKQKPATHAQRQNALSLSPAAASVFWINELSINAKDETAAIEASKALRLSGSAEKATEIAAFGIQSNPESGALWANLGLSLVADKKFEFAIGVLTKAISMNQNNDGLYNALGIAYDNAEKYEEALNAYNKGLSINPNNSDILTNYGLSLALSGKLTEAETILRRAVATPFAPIEARQNLALIIGLQGRLAESEKIATQDLAPDVAAKNIAYLKSILGENQASKSN